jgi:hypothetical protein
MLTSSRMTAMLAISRAIGGGGRLSWSRPAQFGPSGLPDRPALYGVLAQVEALGLDLVEVRQLEPERKSLESGDSRSP